MAGRFSRESMTRIGKRLWSGLLVGCMLISYLPNVGMFPITKATAPVITEVPNEGATVMYENDFEQPLTYGEDQVWSIAKSGEQADAGSMASIWTTGRAPVQENGVLKFSSRNGTDFTFSGTNNLQYTNAPVAIRFNWKNVEGIGSYNPNATYVFEYDFKLTDIGASNNWLSRVLSSSFGKNKILNFTDGGNGIKITNGPGFVRDNSIFLNQTVHWAFTWKNGQMTGKLTNAGGWELYIGKPGTMAVADADYMSFVCEDGAFEMDNFKFSASAPACQEHTWNDGTLTTPVTCTEDGEKTYTCTVCYQKGTAPVPSAGHLMGELIPITPATTQTTGMQAHYECACGKYFDENGVETTVEELTIPMRKTVYYETDFTDPITFSEGSLWALESVRNIGTEPTQQDGTLQFVPGNSVAFNWLEAPELGEYEPRATYVLEFDVTQTAIGKTPGWVSSNDVGVYFGGIPYGTDKTFTAYRQEPDNITAIGNNNYIGGNTFTATVKDVTMHVTLEWQGTTVTTTVLRADGQLLHSAYGDSISKTVTDEKYAIDYKVDGEDVMTYVVFRCEDGAFTLDNVKFSKLDPPCEVHTWNAGTILQDPTCAVQGVKLVTCTVCGTQEEQKIPTLGHTLSELIPEVPATEQAAGVKAHYECSVCHALFDQDGVSTTMEDLEFTLQKTVCYQTDFSDAIAYSEDGVWSLESVRHTGTAPAQQDGVLKFTRGNSICFNWTKIPQLGQYNPLANYIFEFDVKQTALGEKGGWTDNNDVGAYFGGVAYGTDSAFTAYRQENNNITTIAKNTYLGGGSFATVVENVDLHVKLELKGTTVTTTVTRVDGQPLHSALGMSLTNTATNSKYAMDYLLDGQEVMTYLVFRCEEASFTLDNVKFSKEIPVCTTHNWDAGTVTKVATCTRDGEITYHCQACGEVMTQPILASGNHEIGELIPEIPATEQTTGVKAHYECSACHTLFDEDMVETTEAGLIIPIVTIPKDYSNDFTQAPDWTDANGILTLETVRHTGTAPVSADGKLKFTPGNSICFNWTKVPGIGKYSPKDTYIIEFEVKQTAIGTTGGWTDFNDVGAYFGGVAYGTDSAFTAYRQENNNITTIAKNTYVGGAFSNVVKNVDLHVKLELQGTTVTSTVTRVDGQELHSALGMSLTHTVTDSKYAINYTLGGKDVMTYLVFRCEEGAFELDNLALTRIASTEHEHSFGQRIEKVPATNKTDGMEAYYHCQSCDAILDVYGNETTLEDLVIPAGIFFEFPFNTAPDFENSKIWTVEQHRVEGATAPEFSNGVLKFDSHDSICFNWTKLPGIGEYDKNSKYIFTFEVTMTDPGQLDENGKPAGAGTWMGNADNTRAIYASMGAYGYEFNLPTSTGAVRLGVGDHATVLPYSESVFLNQKLTVSLEWLGERITTIVKDSNGVVIGTGYTEKSYYTNIGAVEPANRYNKVMTYLVLRCEDGAFELDNFTFKKEGVVDHAHNCTNLIAEVPSSYNKDGMEAHYVCKTCGAYFNADGKQTAKADLVIPAGLEYRYDFETAPDFENDKIWTVEKYRVEGATAPDFQQGMLKFDSHDSVCFNWTKLPGIGEYDKDTKYTFDFHVKLTDVGGLDGNGKPANAGTWMNNTDNTRAIYASMGAFGYEFNMPTSTGKVRLGIGKDDPTTTDRVEQDGATIMEYYDAMYLNKMIRVKIEWLGEELKTSVYDDKGELLGSGISVKSYYASITAAEPANRYNKVMTYLVLRCEDGAFELHDFTFKKEGAVQHQHTCGELVAKKESTYNANGMEAHYVCSSCGTYFDAFGKQTTKSKLIIPAGVQYTYDFNSGSVYDLLATPLWSIEKYRVEGATAPQIKDGVMKFTTHDSICFNWAKVPGIGEYDANTRYIFDFDVKMTDPGTLDKDGKPAGKGTWMNNSEFTRAVYAGLGGYGYEFNMPTTTGVVRLGIGDPKKVGATVMPYVERVLLNTKLHVRILWEGAKITTILTDEHGDVLGSGYTYREYHTKIGSPDPALRYNKVMTYLVLRCEDGAFELDNFKFKTEDSNFHNHKCGSLISEKPCTETESGFAAHYRCVTCGAYFDEYGKEKTEEELTIAPGMIFEYDFNEGSVSDLVESGIWSTETYRVSGATLPKIVNGVLRFQEYESICFNWTKLPDIGEYSSENKYFFEFDVKITDAGIRNEEGKPINNGVWMNSSENSRTVYASFGGYGYEFGLPTVTGAMRLGVGEDDPSTPDIREQIGATILPYYDRVFLNKTIHVIVEWNGNVVTTTVLDADREILGSGRSVKTYHADINSTDPSNRDNKVMTYMAFRCEDGAFDMDNFRFKKEIGTGNGFMAGSGTPSCNMDLSISGGGEKFKNGDLITLLYYFERKDVTGPYNMYNLKDTIVYDTRYFELVEDNIQLNSGVKYKDVSLGNGYRGIQITYDAPGGGKQWDPRAFVGIFHLRVIGEPGTTALKHQDYAVTVEGATNTSCSAKDLNIIVAQAFAVHFNTNHGSKIEDVMVIDGEKLTRPTDPVRGNKTFAGWYKDSRRQTPWNFRTDTVTEPITLYAKWVGGVSAVWLIVPVPVIVAGAWLVFFRKGGLLAKKKKPVDEVLAAAGAEASEQPDGQE